MDGNILNYSVQRLDSSFSTAAPLLNDRPEPSHSWQ